MEENLYWTEYEILKEFSITNIKNYCMLLSKMPIINLGDISWIILLPWILKGVTVTL